MINGNTDLFQDRTKNLLTLKEALNRDLDGITNESLAAPKKSAVTLYIIIAIKVIKGLALVMLAFGLYNLNGKPLGVGYDSLLRFIRLDPDAFFWGALGNWIDSLNSPVKPWVVSVTLAYGLFSFVEAVGLFLRSRWGGWLAIAESTFFLPIELYKLSLGFTWMIFGIFALNLFIVIYLFKNRNRLFPSKQ